jgi:hypothetical protein
VVLHAPLDALFSQISGQLQPKIEKSKYYQEKDEVTIPVEGNSSPGEKEMVAWETLATMIYSPSLTVMPGGT